MQVLILRQSETCRHSHTMFTSVILFENYKSPSTWQLYYELHEYLSQSSLAVDIPSMSALVTLLAPLLAMLQLIQAQSSIPAPPDPEPISLRTLTLPPAIPDDSPPGTCTAPTGCTGLTTYLESGSFLPDGNHVLVSVTFIGSEESSIYNGQQLLAVKSNGETFDDDNEWKCLTCGHKLEGDGLYYPQAFRDGKRALIGYNIIDCGNHDLVSSGCDNDTLSVHPIRWNTSPDSSGEGGEIRELRLHPDNVHLGFNSFTTTSGGSLGQSTYFSRLEFDPSPTSGLPKVPRYDLVNVTALFNPDAPQPVETSGDALIINLDAPSVGELRGFSGDGTEVFYVGYPAESSNIDVFAVNLESGNVRRLTQHPEYVDPLASSPNGKWLAILDTRGTGRQMWLSGMRDIPPITDLVSTTVTASTRNNGPRRFFQPYLLDRAGDRGTYFGQKLNDQGSGEAGSGDFNDPEWNARADPRWSPDGTQIVWWEMHTVSPECGGENPLPCYPSKEPYSRAQRVVVATLSSREPYDPVVIDPVSDTVSWGVPYIPGSVTPDRPQPSPGTYELKGNFSGFAAVEIYQDEDDTGKTVNGVSVEYFDFSNDGKSILTGTERVETRNVNVTTIFADWHSNLTQTVDDTINTKKTGNDGIQITIDVMTNIFNANGTLITTLDGKAYYQPANGT